MKKKPKYPLKSSSAQIKKAILDADRKIRGTLTKKEYSRLIKIQKDFMAGKTTLNKYMKNRKLLLSRKKIHDLIIRNVFKGAKKGNKDPDLYILGGIAGSGKSEVLKKRIPERSLNLDNDEFKFRLSKYTKSPLKKYVLAHASLLHDESDILFSRALLKALKEKRDLTLDMTFANFNKGRRYMDMFKNAGYDVHLLATQKRPHQSIVHIVSRFLKKGRFVPPGVVAGKGNMINRNVLKARKYADSYIIADTTIKGKPRIVYKSRRKMKTNVRSPKKKKKK